MQRKPKLPKTAGPVLPFNNIVVLGKNFQIKLLQPKENTDCDGYMSLAEQTIAIRLQPAEEYHKDTALHEVTHAVDEMLDLGLSERQVQLIATGLFSVLRQNKEFANWLLS